jgi:hypothetical protein
MVVLGVASPTHFGFASQSSSSLASPNLHEARAPCLAGRVDSAISAQQGKARSQRSPGG